MGVSTETPIPTVSSRGNGEERETWSKKVDFLLSVIGFAVDLANVWRFPYLCYKNGGGAFLIPYLIMLCIGGIPLFYMELALGQYHRKGAITCWGRLVPLFKGIGYAVVLIAFYVDFYYNVIIAWALHYFFSSFTSELPWTRCNNAWNTPNCEEIGSFTNSTIQEVLYANNSSEMVYMAQYSDSEAPIKKFEFPDNATVPKKTSPAAEYFNRAFLELHKSNGIDDLGYVKWDMALCLLAVYIICYFSLWKGISTSGKVVWFTALFPYVVLVILLIRGITLPGAATGIKYYLTPNFKSLLKGSVWSDAATQVFFSLGPGFGVLLAFASYNKFHNNVFKDAIITSLINSATSFLSGFVIFSVLGYMALKSNKHIEDVATEGPGLVFMVYPEAIATMPGSTFWSLIFFMMLLTLGLDSSFGGSEAIITALSDEFPIIGRNREIFVAVLFTVYYVIGLASCAQGGAYVVTLLDRFAAGYSILIAVLFEAIAVSWVYGINRFCCDIQEMINIYPGVYWRVCWRFIGPTFIIIIVASGLIWYEPLTYENYIYPDWSNVFGWGIAASSVLCIPGMAIWQILTTPADRMSTEMQSDLTSILKRQRQTPPIRSEDETSGSTSTTNGIVYSETVKILQEGPTREMVYFALLTYERELYFKQEISFLPKLVPSLYCTTLFVDEENGSIQYTEKIELNVCILPQHYSEQVSISPKECKRNFISEMIYNGYGSRMRHFTTKLEMFISVNLMDVPLEYDRSEKLKTNMLQCNDVESHMNNNCVALNQNHCDTVKNGDNNSDVTQRYITTKAIMIKDN